MQIFLDQDDTLANFRDYAIERGVPPWEGAWYATDPATWTQEQHDIQAATNALMAREDFWPNLPVMPGAHEIIAAASQRAPTFILTAYPRTCPDRETVRRQKIEWAMRRLHVPAERIIVCNRADKIKYATAPETGETDWGGPPWKGKPNLLVDDAPLNCEEWEAAGGKSILFRRDPYEAIDHIKNWFDV